MPRSVKVEGVVVLQFRPQRRDLLGQPLHEAHVPRVQLCFRHDGDFS
jgi:hypothetical protein